MPEMQEQDEISKQRYIPIMQKEKVCLLQQKFFCKQGNCKDRLSLFSVNFHIENFHIENNLKT